MNPKSDPCTGIYLNDFGRALENILAADEANILYVPMERRG
jgi:hypothetical protein